MSPRKPNRWIGRWLGARLGLRLGSHLGAGLGAGRSAALGFWHLLRQWWRVDRIRISPQQGQLLRIEPPCIIRVNSVIAQVLSRSAGCNGAGPYVAYECRTERGSALLWICPVGPSHRQQVRWVEDDQTCDLSPDMVEVYGQAGRISIDPQVV